MLRALSLALVFLVASCTDLPRSVDAPAALETDGGSLDGGPPACAAECASCGDGGVCIAGECRASICGDGCLDTARGEQCDDGNLVNLDGCDSQCRFEQALRANSLTMQWSTDSFCNANALGVAIGSRAQPTLQSQLDANVAAGTLTMAFQALGLADLTGQSAPSFKLGALSGKPFAAAPGHHYDGTRDLDWWYAAPAEDLDEQRRPLAQLDALIDHAALQAGPGHMEISLVFGSGPMRLAASSVRLVASVGAASAPGTARDTTPGHLASEHLDPALVSFASLAGGELCANVSADSLSRAPTPQSLQRGGAAACDEGYDSSSSMLDVLVNGCSMYGGFVTIISPGQPDQVDGDAPPAGSGGPYQLSITSRRVSDCSDASGASVDLSACLRAAAYSAFLGFGADRVILK